MTRPSLATMLGDARFDLEDAQTFARLLEGGTATYEIPARGDVPARTVDVDVELRRLLREAKATIDDVLARRRLEVGR